MVRELKHTEIGDIPVDWELQTFDETFRVISNNTLSRENLNNRGGAVRNIHYGDILTKFPEVLDCSEEDISYVNDISLLSSSIQLLQDGDVVIADTAEDETVGKVTEVQNLGNSKLVAGLHTIPCRVKKGDFAPGWLGYYMNSFLFHRQILPFVTGIKVSSISKSGISGTLILVPPIEEQKKIVQSLNEVHLLMDAETKVISKIKFVKNGCLSKMFPQKDDTVPEMRLPGFTEAWEQRKLGEVVSVYDGVHQTPEYQSEGIMFLSVENISTMTSSKYISEEAFERDYKIYPEKSDILMTRIGDVGTSNVVETAEKVAFYVSLALLKPHNIDSYFLNNAIQSPYMQKGIRNRTLLSAIPQKINKDEIGKVDIIFPENTTEQKKIGEYFSNLDNLITLHQCKCDKYSNIKKGMMSDLLTGKIRLV